MKPHRTASSGRAKGHVGVDFWTHIGLTFSGLAALSPALLEHGLRRSSVIYLAGAAVCIAVAVVARRLPEGPSHGRR